ncbi:MAG TPA: penicillin-binding protein 1C, partial [Phenylobacterium sp.]
IFPPDHATVEAPGFGPASRGLALAAAGGAERLNWYVNGAALAVDPVSERVIWRPRGAGFYTVTVVDAEGRKAVARVQVKGG